MWCKYLIIIAFAIKCCEGNTQNYELIQERLDILYYNEKYLKMEGHIGKINRRQFGQNMTITVYKDLPEDVEWSGIANRFLSNTYRMTAIQVKIKICDKIDKEYKVIVYPEISRFGKFIPPSCPIRKGIYWFRNYVIDEDYLPADLPEWKLRVDENITTKNELLASFSVYLRIDKNIGYRRKSIADTQKFETFKKIYQESYMNATAKN